MHTITSPILYKVEAFNTHRAKTQDGWKGESRKSKHEHYLNTRLSLLLESSVAAAAACGSLQVQTRVGLYNPANGRGHMQNGDR